MSLLLQVQAGPINKEILRDDVEAFSTKQNEVTVLLKAQEEIQVQAGPINKEILRDDIEATSTKQNEVTVLSKEKEAILFPKS